MTNWGAPWLVVFETWGFSALMKKSHVSQNREMGYPQFFYFYGCDFSGASPRLTRNTCPSGWRGFISRTFHGMLVGGNVISNPAAMQCLCISSTSSTQTDIQTPLSPSSFARTNRAEGRRSSPLASRTGKRMPPTGWCLFCAPRAPTYRLTGKYWYTQRAAWSGQY